jgi:hypothetical protein
MLHDFFETKIFVLPRLGINHAYFNALKYKLFFFGPQNGSGEPQKSSF